MTRHSRRLVYGCRRAHETTELNNALESFNVDLEHLQRRLIENRCLHLGGDDAVVDVLTCSLLLRGRRATDNGDQGKSEEKCRKLFAKLFHD